jgi:hypothetical protein
MLLDPSGHVYPRFVHKPEQRKRWDSCTRVAVAAWEKLEPGAPTGAWMLYTTHSLYFTDTDTPADPDPPSRRRDPRGH